MKKRIVVSIVLFLVFLCKSQPTFGQNSNEIKRGNLRVLVLEGTPYQRGLEHGKALKKDIQSLIELWRTDLERTYKINADKFIAKFLKETNFQNAIKKWTPDLWEELSGGRFAHWAL